VTRHGPRASIEVRSTIGWPLKSRPSSLRHAPIRSNYTGKIVVEGKGFVYMSALSNRYFVAVTLQNAAKLMRHVRTGA
jgi:hypothetical protein